MGFSWISGRLRGGIRCCCGGELEFSMGAGRARPGPYARPVPAFRAAFGVVGRPVAARCRLCARPTPSRPPLPRPARCVFGACRCLRPAGPGRRRGRRAGGGGRRPRRGSVAAGCAMRGAGRCGSGIRLRKPRRLRIRAGGPVFLAPGVVASGAPSLRPGPASPRAGPGAGLVRRPEGSSRRRPTAGWPPLRTTCFCATSCTPSRHADCRCPVPALGRDPVRRPSGVCPVAGQRLARRCAAALDGRSRGSRLGRRCLRCPP